MYSEATDQIRHYFQTKYIQQTIGINTHNYMGIHNNRVYSRQANNFSSEDPWSDTYIPKTKSSTTYVQSNQTIW